jgi:enoyl-CoA hydratase
VVPAADLDTTVMEIAQEIAKRSPLAIKFAVNVIRGLGIDAVRRVMNEEKLGQTAIFASEDYQELKAARAENREPKFRGR